MYIDTSQDGSFEAKNQKTYYSDISNKPNLNENKEYIKKLDRLEKFINTKRTIICEFILTDTIIEGELLERKEDVLKIKSFDKEILIDPTKIQEINILKV